MSFTPVKKVVVRIHNGKRQRDWVLGAIKRHGSKQLVSAPLGEDRIVIQVKKGDKLFLTQEPSLDSMGLVPIFKVGERGDTFGIMGYYPRTREQIVASVINAK